MIGKIRSSCRLLSTVFVLFVGLSSQQALAHAHLKVETPKADASVSPAPKALTLSFSEGIEPNFSGVKITGPDNAVVKTGKLQLDPNNNTQVNVPIESELSAGKYNVSWHVVSVDGHKTKGQYSFTVN
ncbi:MULTISPECIES: CopC domain-containing protein YobA [Serratia]|uniref:Copper resistance protein C n=1 Tax=Serratia marcescens TaxID=615 RepID=A0A379ZYW4_SERMA|nr:MULTISPECIES: CopC domain-containing protein YobA [Serratia]KFD12196.1 copper resistance protein C [Serratia marcescens subsp. marcescens ATCC 13880]KFL03801.1 protein YobA [Serratia marcescens]MCC3248965.1 CopC domain-containing protein YobA [Serratia marcescens]CAI0882172.1 Copper resistance protein CopC [Serratia marcescens]CAI0885538.1 Copper resistance protein CopC [Serratia marcescens]